MQDFLIITISIFAPTLLGYGIRRFYIGRNKNIPPPGLPDETRSSFAVTQKPFDSSSDGDFEEKKENPYKEN